MPPFQWHIYHIMYYAVIYTLVSLHMCSGCSMILCLFPKTALTADRLFLPHWYFYLIVNTIKVIDASHIVSQILNSTGLENEC